MLTPRQQHCLDGIGITAWQTRPARDAVEAIEALSPPLVDAPNVVPKPSESPARRVPPPTAAPAVEAKAESPRPAAAPVELTLNDWEQTLQAIEDCQQCDLARTCTRKVPGKGFQQADVMIIGEAPGHDEDIQGQPFVGRAGQLLDKMLAAIELSTKSVYITNILKCRPPGNRDPHVDEIAACSQFLRAQIKLVAPKVILSVGRISAQNLLKQQSPLGRLRNQQHVLPDTDIPLLVTYHPAYLLRTPSEKAKSWEDLKALHRLLNTQ